MVKTNSLMSVFLSSNLRKKSFYDERRENISLAFFNQTEFSLFRAFWKGVKFFSGSDPYK